MSKDVKKKCCGGCKKGNIGQNISCKANMMHQEFEAILNKKIDKSEISFKTQEYEI